MYILVTFHYNFKISSWCLSWEWKYVYISVAFSLKFEEFLVILNGKGNMSMISLRSDVKTLKYLIYFRTFPTDGPETISFVDVRQTESTLVQGTCGQTQFTGDNIPLYEGIHQEFVSFLAHFIYVLLPYVVLPNIFHPSHKSKYFCLFAGLSDTPRKQF